MRVVLLLFVALLAGCTQEVKEPVEAHVAWPTTVEIETTALEPFEFRGALRMTWSNGMVGLFVEAEDAMFRQYIRDGDTWYATMEGRGWVTFEGNGFHQSSQRAYRPLIWDVPAWAGDPVPTPHASSIAYRGQQRALHVDVEHDAGAFVSARITTDLDPESPYTVTPTSATLPFAVTVPAKAREASEVEAKDDVARERHVQIIQWLRAHYQQQGSAPREVNADSLALQRLNQPWPINPYDGQGLRGSGKSGHFLWQWCSDQDATYTGYGWDTSPVSDSFGAGCQV